MKLRLEKLLMLTLIQGEICFIFSIPDHNAVVSNSDETDAEYPDDIPNPNKAYLPPHVNEYVNVKNRKTVQKRAVGRQVNIPASVIESMANTPVSALSTKIPANQKVILDCHNNYRRNASPSARNMLKMIWNAKAANTAEAWAKKCKEGHSPQNERTIPDLRCGENLFYSAFLVPWNIVIDSWYSEHVDFKYGTEPPSEPEVGHYTQMMWATSHAIGCAIVECPNSVNRFVYCCHNCPAGNKGSKKHPWKEGKPCADCPNSCENNLCTNPCPVEDKYTNCVNFQTTCSSKPSMTTDCTGTCQCTKGEIK
ncbi:serotriflin-like [Bufo bufo]|uniref:serotriflin-like n=1 Tax=Bufo bufo TaxID=8384 RepID=UPI001ABE879E|nr:serotriflin-like [Bufo bufo]